MRQNEDLMNGHPLRVLRTQLDLSQKDFAAQVGVSEATISRAESGHRLSPKVRRQLCDRLGMTSEDLGLMGRKREVMYPSTTLSYNQKQEYSPSENLIEKPSENSNAPNMVTPFERTPNTPFSLSSSFTQQHSQGILRISQSPDMPLLTSPHFTTEQQESTWLTQGVSSLGQLFTHGWSLDEILSSITVILRGIEAMPMEMHQHLPPLASFRFMDAVPFTYRDTISEEERAHLCEGLGKSIGQAWQLFHTAGNAQVLAVGQTLLYLIRQNHSILFPQVRSLYYTAVYNLIGLAWHFQEYHQNALEAHINAHLAAMSTGDISCITQSLICLSNAYQALNQPIEAIRAIEEALQLTEKLPDDAYPRTKAHLLGCWADIAMTIEDYRIAQQKLEAAVEFLDQIHQNEEFDTASWFQLAGRYALMTNDNTKAIDYLEKALTMLPPNWLLRSVITAVPLAAAYARKRERDASLMIAQKAIPALHAMDASKVNKHFRNYIQQDLLGCFPHDPQVRSFVEGVSHQLPLLL